MNWINKVMSRVKCAVGLPDTVSVLGVVRMCPILVFFSLLIVAALAVLLLN
jgi:hypothetical protein